MMPRILVGAGLVAMIACAQHTSGPAAGAESPRAGLAVRPPDSVCSRLLSGPDTVAARPPQVDSMIVPPMPVPSRMRNVRYTVSVLVTTTGRIAQDSTVIEPVMDAGYEQHFRERLRRLHFIPANVERCPVARRFELHFIF